HPSDDPVLRPQAGRRSWSRGFAASSQGPRCAHAGLGNGGGPTRGRVLRQCAGPDGRRSKRASSGRERRGGGAAERPEYLAAPGGDRDGRGEHLLSTDDRGAQQAPGFVPGVDAYANLSWPLNESKLIEIRRAVARDLAATG